MKKILFNLFVISAILMIAVTATGAYFSDSATINDNTVSLGSWAEPAINEIYSNPATGMVEWIELKNNRPVAISLSGYSIEDNTAIPKNLSVYSIAASGYLVLEKGTDFSFGLNNSGDMLILKKVSVIVDKVSYGDYPDGNVADNAPAPGYGESVARVSDGSDTDIDINDFQIRSGGSVTKGSPNV